MVLLKKESWEVVKLTHVIIGLQKELDRAYNKKRSPKWKDLIQISSQYEQFALKLQREETDSSKTI